MLYIHLGYKKGFKLIASVAYQSRIIHEIVDGENCYALIATRWWKDKFSDSIFSWNNTALNNRMYFYST